MDNQNVWSIMPDLIQKSRHFKWQINFLLSKWLAIYASMIHQLVIIILKTCPKNQLILKDNHSKHSHWKWLKHGCLRQDPYFKQDLYSKQDLKQSKRLDHSKQNLCLKQDLPKCLCLKQDQLLLIDPSENGITEKKDWKRYNFKSYNREERWGVPQLLIII